MVKLSMLIFLFLFSIFNSICQNNIDVRQITLENENALIFSGKYNLFVNSIFRNDNKLDSSKLLGFFKELNTQNNDFHIPSSQELELFEKKSYKIPGGVINRESCKKTRKCCLDDFWYNGGHFHLCNKCIHWTKTQREYNVCKNCNSIGWTFCGKTIICGACKGKGYVEILAEDKYVDLATFLTNANKIENTVLLFYDNPQKFGLYRLNQDTFKTINFGESFDDFNMEKYSFVLIRGHFSVEKEIEDYKHMIKVNDDRISSEIDYMLKNGIPEKAAVIFNDLISKQLILEYQNKIQKQLNLKFSNEKVNIELVQGNRIIYELVLTNRDFFSDLEIGRHILKIDKSGQVSINGKQLMGTNISAPVKTFGKSGEFSVLQDGVVNIKITIDTTALTNEIERLQTYGGYTVSQTLLGRYYRKRFLNSSIFNSSGVKTESNQILSKSKIITVKKFKINKFVNDDFLKSSYVDIELRSNKLARRLPYVLLKSLTWSFGSFWAILRIYEYKLIPK